MKRLDNSTHAAKKKKKKRPGSGPANFLAFKKFYEGSVYHPYRWSDVVQIVICIGELGCGFRSSFIVKACTAEEKAGKETVMLRHWITT